MHINPGPGDYRDQGGNYLHYLPTFFFFFLEKGFKELSRFLILLVQNLPTFWVFQVKKEFGQFWF